MTHNDVKEFCNQTNLDRHFYELFLDALAQTSGSEGGSHLWGLC